MRKVISAKQEPFKMIMVYIKYMPLVKIYYSRKLEQTDLREIVPKMSECVSELLSFQSGQERVTIRPSMVKIRFKKSSSLDANMPDLCVEVEAKSYSVRIAEIDTYSKKLANALVPLLPKGIRLAAWFKLCYGSWQARDT